MPAWARNISMVWTAPQGDCMYNQEICAPEIHFINDRWYIYFAADDGSNYNHASADQWLQIDDARMYRYTPKH